MKSILISIILFLSSFAHSQEKIKFNFVSEDLTKIIDLYAKASGTRFVIDSTVRGSITLLNPTDITLPEAYNQLTEAISINGFSIIPKYDYTVIRNARSAQRDGIEVSTNLPALRPNRMATWIVSLKNISAFEFIQFAGRMANSSYGEIVANKNGNQLIISDFTSALHRLNAVIQEIDKPKDLKLNKIIESGKKIETEIKIKREQEEKIETAEIKKASDEEMKKIVEDVKKETPPAKSAETPSTPVKAVKETNSRRN